MRIINFKNITFQFSLFLLIFGFISLIDHLIYGTDGTSKSYYFINLGLIAGIFTFWYFLLQAFKNVTLNVLNLAITAIILFLLIHPITPWLYIILTAFVTLLFKLFVRYKGSPVFNPASMGLFVAYYVTYAMKQAGMVEETLFISWWGGDLIRNIWDQGMLRFVPVLILFGLAYFVWKFRKTNHALAFAATYIGLSTAVLPYTGIMPALSYMYMLTITAFAFLVLVMVSEPKTSPIRPWQQIILGVVGGLIVFWTTFKLPSSWKLFSEIDPFVLGLVFLNLLTFITKYVMNKRTVLPKNQATSPTAPISPPASHSQTQAPVIS